MTEKTLEKEIENKDSKAELKADLGAKIFGGVLFTSLASLVISIIIYGEGGLGVRKTTTEYISKYKNTPLVVKKEDVRFGMDRYYITLDGSKISEGKIIDDYNTTIFVSENDFWTYRNQNEINTTGHRTRRE